MDPDQTAPKGQSDLGPPKGQSDLGPHCLQK